MKTSLIYKYTTENWCPNYHKNLVEIVFYNQDKNPSAEPGDNRVIVSGNDDMMMEYDGLDAEEKFLEIIQLEDVTFDALKKIGLFFF